MFFLCLVTDFNRLPILALTHSVSLIPIDRPAAAAAAAKCGNSSVVEKEEASL
jgi:hypothetical protein